LRASRRTATSETEPAAILRDGASRLLRMRSVPPLPLSELSLTRTPAGLGCTTALPSCRRLRCAGAATSNHRRVVEHSDGDCSDDYGDAQHERHHAGVGPVANAATVRPLSLAFLVQRSIPLRPRGALRLLCHLVGSVKVKTRRRLLVWVAQSSMQFAQQVRDPLRHCFGNLGSCGQLAGDSCLNFFDDYALARRLQGRCCAVSTGHSSTQGASDT
jgi:hypothetical protein